MDEVALVSAGALASGGTPFDRAYVKLIRNVLFRGTMTPSRQRLEDGTPVETLSITAEQIRVPLPKLVWNTHDDGTLRSMSLVGMPILTVKHIATGVVVEELAAFLRGSTNAYDFNANGCRIWNSDAEKFDARQARAGERHIPGDLGPIYGFAWRRHPRVDQIRHSCYLLASDPYSRRNLVSAWDVERLDEMALPPCHFAFQFKCRNLFKGAVDELAVDCIVYMRSTDVGLGLPFNVVQYSLLTSLCVAEAQRLSDSDWTKIGGCLRNYQLGELVVVMGDCHVYSSHIAELKMLTVPEGPKHEPFEIELPAALASVDGFAFADREARKGLFTAAPRAPRIALSLHT